MLMVRTGKRNQEGKKKEGKRKGALYQIYVVVFISLGSAKELRDIVGETSVMQS